VFGYVWFVVWKYFICGHPHIIIMVFGLHPLHLYDVKYLMVPNLSVHLEIFLSVIAMIGKSCRFCILLGGFGSSGVLIGGLVSGSGVWRKFWLGRFMKSGCNVDVCGCMLHGGWHISVQFVLQKRCDASLSAFLMVGVIFVWYCLNSFSFMMFVLLGSVICSKVVMFSSSSCWRYLRLRFRVIVE
jgi:hypothetical protein